MNPWKLLRVAVDLPAFLVGVFLLYWSVPLSVLQGKLQFWKLRGKRDDAYGWGHGLQTLFWVKVLQLPGPTLYQGDNVIYLANHRCWADFFLDVVMTDGRAQMLSRMAVFMVFPAFMLAVWALKSVVLFKRGGRVDIEKFNNMVDRKMRESPVQGLIVYPEGHRSTKHDSLPLKRGMLRYCYDHKRTVQIVMTSNKEAVLSEKDMRSHFGQTVVVGYADPIHPGEYSTFEDFLAKVQASWDAEWKRIYTADKTTARPRPPFSYDVHDYPLSIKIYQIIFQGLSCVLFFVTLFWSVKGVAAFPALFGAYKALVTSLLVVWFGISLARAFVPVNYPLSPYPAPKQQ